MRRASCIVRQHLKTNIQTSFSIKLLHLQFSNFTWSMTCHQGIRIIKLGQVEYPRWPPLLKIAKITKSTFSPELLDILNFGFEYQWNTGIQNCKNEKNLKRSFVTMTYFLFTSVTLLYLKIAYLNNFKQLFFLKPLRKLLSNFT